jgi:hypothetical protein
MPLTDQQRHQTEARIRAAIEQLLRGELPPGGRCDIKTLARVAGISRAALYRTYPHLKDAFEQRLAQARAAGEITDPRDAQILRLKTEVQTLKQRITERDAAIAELTDFRTQALSRLAAQHDELHRLRADTARHGNVRALPTRGDRSFRAEADHAPT